jgi:hypothetical protein
VGYEGNIDGLAPQWMGEQQTIDFYKRESDHRNSKTRIYFPRKCSPVGRANVGRYKHCPSPMHAQIASWALPLQGGLWHGFRRTQSDIRATEQHNFLMLQCLREHGIDYGTGDLLTDGKENCNAWQIALSIEP